jgi:flagellar basal-body rod modification protein FlgD
MSGMLECFAKEAGLDAMRRAVVVLDGAGWHTAGDLRVPEGVHLVRLPAYSPELQPAERVWPIINEAIANREFADLPELMATIDARCYHLDENRDYVSRVTNFHWWPGYEAQGVPHPSDKCAMSSLSGVTSSSDLAAATGSTGGTSDLDKDAFLRLLTTQLQHQDPLNPMENSEFVAQLAQFSSLEQLQGLSAGMESLYMVNMSMNNAALTGLIGKDVVANGDTFHYSGSGDEVIHYDAATSATSSTLTITNSDGVVVASVELGALPEGAGSYTWNGKDQNGQVVPEGDYTFTVEATDAAGESVEVTEQMVGRIDGMDLSSGSPMLTIDGVPVDLASVQSLEEAS